MLLKINVILMAFIVVYCDDEIAVGDSVANFQMYNCVSVNNCTTTDCESKICNCNVSVGYFYNETVQDCEFNLKLLLKTLVNKYDTKEQILKESMEIFRGIEVAGLLVVVCASLGFLAGCFYCVRLKYKDGKLKSEVNALPEKIRKQTERHDHGARRQLLPIEESCGVIVGDAGIYVV